MLTKRQKQVFDFIKSFRDKKGYSTSLEEIKKHLGLSSVSTAHHHVKSLQDMGYLKKQDNLPRAIEIYETQQMIQIPVLGRIAAGQPILAVEDREVISIPQTEIRKNGQNLFALRVVGQSMIGENINDGDIIIAKSQKTALDGQKVVALVNNEEVTLKKIYKDKKNGKIKLLPSNTGYDPIIVDQDNLIIQGIVVDIIKHLENESEILERKHTQKAKLSSTKINNLINHVIEGDCLQIMKYIPSKSIDMILCDLPYGTTQNQWDSIIPLDKLWKHYERIIKDNGVIALTAQGLFTANLMLSNQKLFKYKIVWVKSKPTNFLNAKKQPLRKYEDICIFYKNQPIYYPQMSYGEPYNKGFRKDQLTGSYGDFKTVEVKSNGERYPTDVIYFKTAESEGQVYHPTQKPVELGRYLIRTFTKRDEIVLDNACGSGSFLVSAVLEGRKFIGIEKNKEVYLHKKYQVDYINVCNKRIKEAEERYKTSNLKLF